MKKLLLISALMVGAVTSQVDVRAQQPNFPTKAVTIIVPYSPGGGSDNVSRATAKYLSELWHQPVIVENVPGADGLIGARRVMNAQPDGYTLFVSIPAIAILKYINKTLDKDPLDYLTPVSILATGPTAIVVKGNTGVNSIEDLKKKCTRSTENCSWASGEPFTLLAGSGLVSGMGLSNMTNIRYAGTSAAVNDVIGGHVTMMVTGTSSVLTHHKAGSMKILAVSSSQRIPELPDVPTYAESGLGKVEFTNNWYGIFAPVGTPELIKQTIADGFKKAAQDPGVLRILTPLLLTPVGSSPAAFAETLARDKATVERLAPSVITAP